MNATRNSPPAARLACSTILFRRHPLRVALAGLAAAGVPVADIGALPGYCDHFDPAAGPAAVADWVAVVRAAGVAVHTLNADIGAFNDSAAPPAAVRERGLTCLGAAAAVGARGVTVGPGVRVDRTVRPLDGELERIAPWFRLLADRAADAGLVLTFEAPHRGGLIADAAEARRLVEAVGHPNARLIFDVGHHLRAGWDLAAAVAETGPWIEHVHLKDQAAGRGCYPLGTGAVDFPALFGALARIGYAGRFAFEFPDAADTAGAAIELVRASRIFLENLRPLPSP